MAELLRPESYEPKEQFSPSGLGLASLCEMAWFYRYVFGQKEADLLDWGQAKELERPEKPTEGSPARLLAAHREDVKEFNRLTRRALGHAVHSVFALHYDWHPPLALIDWTDRPGAVAIAGLPFLPAHEDCAEIHVEQELSMQWGPDDDPVKVWGFADLIVRLLEKVECSDAEVYKPGSWVLLDYKTTYNFDYVPLVEELERDVAACFYALECMVKLELAAMPCRWVYFLTDEKKPEDSRAVTFTITRERAIEVLTPIEALALKLRMVMRRFGALTPPPGRPEFQRKQDAHLLLKHNPVHCENMFGAPCVYYHQSGGDCRPPRATAGQRIAHLRTKEDLLRKRREFQRSLQNGAPSPRRPRKGRTLKATAPRSARHVTSTENEGRQDTMGKFNTEGGPPAETTATAAPKTRAPRTPKAAPAAPPADETPALYLTSEKPAEGVSLEVPQGSPLYARNLAFINAAFAE